SGTPVFAASKITTSSPFCAYRNTWCPAILKGKGASSFISLKIIRGFSIPIITPVSRLIPLSQVNQNLGLAGQIRNGAGFEFFGRSWSVCSHAGRSPSAPRPAPDCRHAFAGIVAPDDIPVTRRWMVRGEPEHGFQRDVPVKA